MNYAKILTFDVANGPGFRTSLFVSGCGRKCKGCFNESAQNPNFGHPFNEKVKMVLFDLLSDEKCDGLSLLGGEPMSILSDNRRVVLDLIKDVKTKFPQKTIWMWTGYLIEDLFDSFTPEDKEIFNMLDVVIDGAFVEELKNLDLVFRGSSNQHIWVKSKKEKKFVNEDGCIFVEGG